MSFINKVQIVGGQQTSDFNDNFLLAADDVFTLVAPDASDVSCKKNGGKSFVSVITPSINNGRDFLNYIFLCKFNNIHFDLSTWHQNWIALQST